MMLCFQDVLCVSKPGYEHIVRGLLDLVFFCLFWNLDHFIFRSRDRAERRVLVICQVQGYD